MKIISAEDNDVNQKILEFNLKGKYKAFTKVYNGQDLLDELEKNQYDLILLDIQMPLLDGLAAARIIRNDLKLFDIPILVISGYKCEDVFEKEDVKLINEYILKPFTKEELYEKIEKVCK